MGVALRIAGAAMADDAARIGALRERLWQGLARLPGVTLNGHATRRAPGILSVSFDGVEGESLLYSLPQLAVASGSACATTSGEPSYVLRALGRSDRLAQTRRSRPSCRPCCACANWRREATHERSGPALRA
jgi:cysteine desulfurase